MSKILTIPFTEPFIERLADHIEQEHISKGRDLRRLGIVFGGRRPSLFLKRALARRVKSVFYSPVFLTIDEFMGRVTASQNRQGLLDLDHCFAIYQLAGQHAPQVLEGRREFVQFLPWAREILHFMEQLDLEDTPQSALEAFSRHAAMGFNVPADINKLLESLMLLRRHYHVYLDEHQRASRGYQYLNASRLAAQTPLPEFDHILFCNFFYLHRTEMAVIREFFQRGQASLVVQGDQRRWPALKRISADLGREIFEGKAVVPTEFDLKLYAAFDMHAQAGLVSEILRTITDHQNTVIVLPDPGSMLPLLSAIGPQLKEFNISLGYPLKRSSLYALLDTIIEAHKTMNGRSYYSRDYLRVLRHPLVKGLDFGLPAGSVNVLVHTLEQVLTGAVSSGISGQIFLSLEDILGAEELFERCRDSLAAMDIAAGISSLKNLMEQLHSHLFGQWQGVNSFWDLAGVLDNFCGSMAVDSSMPAYPLNGRMSLRLRQIAAEWAAAQFGRQKFGREDLLRLMQERLEGELVAFSGSPLRGLQVLGLLETRSLSFKHVIVLDVNEGILPNLNIYEPLIPREVMINMNLDRLELEEEIQRYQFMRLISSAEHVHLIYQDRPDKERSRFIEELIWEKEQKAGQRDVVEIERPAFQVALEGANRAAVKTPAILEYLKNFKFSATSLNTYARNPYEFYLNYVLGLREKEDLLDEPESRHIGIFIHGLLEEAFKPWLGKKPVMDAAFCRSFLSRFESRFHDDFGRGLKTDAFLIKAVLEHRLGRFLEVEAARVEAQVKELLFIERKFEDVIEFSCGPVHFQYRVDRVERLNDETVLIVDYKTGGLEPSAGRPSFQMPLYLHYLDKYYPGRGINAALYSLKTMEMQKFLNSKTRQSREELLAQLRQDLDSMMTEIFNPKIPFIDQALEVE